MIKKLKNSQVSTKGCRAIDREGGKLRKIFRFTGKFSVVSKISLRLQENYIELSVSLC
jgi:hypothetical protein